MKSILLFLLSASLTLANPSPDYGIAMMRGLWNGYHSKLHHNLEQLDPRCFGQDSSDEVEAILEFIAYGHWYEVL